MSITSGLSWLGLGVGFAGFFLGRASARRAEDVKKRFWWCGRVENEADSPFVDGGE
jgi:hypothetical protein